ncbi:hypothetical protein Msil_3088 [Methylocella silvestris BL2]|uniref:Uncharacterized protein n=1 Tax=Methylocella silvestris (strain DSM 15510 / CIP 108128 / LMG 27833 / NCIMB 13906 / BL2) TaxID=395965 RepID=B8EKW9_METSB|nr:hypothetical protein [Methylocella silvestris]ACK51997.1 hypothetical protein Msil_3088 [Methylocella silvestris BL2]
MAEAIILRDDGEAAFDKHNAAYERARALVIEAESAVAAADAAVEQFTAAAHVRLVDCLYSCDADVGVVDEVSEARVRLVAAQDNLRIRSQALATVEARKSQVGDALGKLNKDVDAAAKDVVRLLGDAAVDAALEAEQRALQAKIAVSSIVRCTPSNIPSQTTSRAARYLGGAMFEPWPAEGVRSGDETKRRKDQSDQHWKAVLDALKRDPDAPLPAI